MSKTPSTSAAPSRRVLVAGIAATPLMALPAAADVLASANFPAGGKLADPVFAALDACRRAEAEWRAAAQASNQAEAEWNFTCGP